jgi:hypothetical protein
LSSKTTQDEAERYWRDNAPGLPEDLLPRIAAIFGGIYHYSATQLPADEAERLELAREANARCGWDGKTIGFCLRRGGRVVFDEGDDERERVRVKWETLRREKKAREQAELNAEIEELGGPLAAIHEYKRRNEKQIEELKTELNAECSKLESERTNWWICMGFLAFVFLCLDPLSFMAVFFTAATIAAIWAIIWAFTRAFDIKW